MSEEMPKWPEPLRVSVFREQWARDEAIAIAAHCAANYEAALTRLHRAVATLTEIAENPGYDNAWAREARDALKAIGPLPALPTREGDHV